MKPKLATKYCPCCCRTLYTGLFGKSGRTFSRMDPLNFTKHCSECISYRSKLAAQDPYAEYKTCQKCYNTYNCLMFSSESNPLVCYFCCSDTSRVRNTAAHTIGRREKYNANPTNASRKANWMREYMRQQSKDLTDTYIKITISQSCHLPFSAITQEMIQLKRALIFAKRAVAFNHKREKQEFLLDFDRLKERTPLNETKH
jgi:hypothetical protein